MSMETMFLVSILACIVLAAIGARLADAAPWKGAVLAVAYLAATLAAGLFQVSILLMLIAGVVAIGIVAGALALKNKQSINIALGCLIGYWAPIFVLPSLATT